VTLAAWGAYAPQSATFEYWGPECGVEGGTCPTAASTLANTGVDVSGIALLASALLAVGIIVVLRRRAVKA
jgi:LPXTG-motif cell wall-anchored protein